MLCEAYLRVSSQSSARGKRRTWQMPPRSWRATPPASSTATTSSSMADLPPISLVGLKDWHCAPGWVQQSRPPPRNKPEWDPARSAAQPIEAVGEHDYL